MSFLLRTIAHASSSRSFAIRAFSQSSSLLSPDTASSSSNSVPNLPTSPVRRRSVSLNRDVIDGLAPNRKQNDPDGWWPESVKQTGGDPGDQYTGRSISLQNNRRDLPQALRMLAGLLTRTGVKRDVKRGEFYERPGLMRQRLKSERHRRRFQEMVRTKVQLVQAMRNRR